MKINRKGFMLAEVVVISVVISAVLVTLFIGLKSVSSAFETRNRYYDVDSLYAAIELNEVLLRNDVSLEGRINDAAFLYNWVANDGEIDENYVQEFEEFYKEVGNYIFSYITPYDRDKMLSLESVDGKTNATFFDYLDYLGNNLNFEDNYDYMIIVERRENNNIDDCYYYALKLKY